MKTLIRFLFLLVLLIGAHACTSDSDLLFFDENGVIDENGSARIQSISSNGQIKQKFIYDSYGRVTEDQGLFFYNRYLYNNNGRLEKVETAADTRYLSSSAMLPLKTELMTSENTSITSYSSYKYDKDGRLSEIEYYFMKDGKKFELTSIRSFEYEDVFICRENLCDEKGKMGHYYEYEYDENGNRTKERYFAPMIPDAYSNQKLMYEATYQYDNKINPYRVLSLSGPRFYTSANNMTEMTTIWYADPRTTTAKQSFTYNDKGYPVKMIYDGGEEEYTYYAETE